jgi:hypothetical protein
MNTSTSHIVIFNVAKDLHYHIESGVMKPMPRAAALAAIANTAAMLTSGNLVRFAVDQAVA